MTLFIYNPSIYIYIYPPLYRSVYIICHIRHFSMFVCSFQSRDMLLSVQRDMFSLRSNAICFAALSAICLTSFGVPGSPSRRHRRHIAPARAYRVRSTYRAALGGISRPKGRLLSEQVPYFRCGACAADTLPV